MKKHLLTSIALALTVTFAGCGGGGSDAPSSTTTPPPTNNGGSTVTPGAAKVAGPLDAVQTPISQQVIAPLSSAFTGTPLQGVAVCVDQIVVTDTVDVLDVLALAIQNSAGSADPQAALTGAAAGVQAQLENVVIDLQGMLGALDGKTNTCLGNVAPTGSNPLAGTPLAPVGATLAPVLDQIYDALHGTSGNTRPSLSLTTIASLAAQLKFAVDSAFAQVPDQVASAPVVGAALSTVQTAVSNLTTTVTAASMQNTAATQAAIASTLNNLLSGVLLNVVPVTMIEDQAGQSGMLSAPIAAAISQVSSQVGTNLGVVLQPVLSQNIDAILSPVIDGMNASVLDAILAPLFDLLGGAGTSTTNPLGPVTSILESFFSGASTAGNPLDLILEVVSGGSTCPLAGTPLEALCGVL